MGFSENLKEAREKKGFAQEQLADLLQLPLERVMEWERDGVYPEMEELVRLAEALDTSLDSLLLDKETLAKKEQKEKKKAEKWEFEDYAYTFTGILVGFLMVGPELVYEFLGISILGGSFGDAMEDVTYELERGFGNDILNITVLRALSPMLFLLTTTIVLFKDAFDARKSGGYTGSLFKHTFGSLLEDAIYMAITTVMVFGAVLFGMMYISWLAGPITWILFLVLFPLVRSKREKEEKFEMPWFLLFVFFAGIIGEIITGAWIAFPMAWLLICCFKFIDTIRYFKTTVDAAFDLMYYAFSVVLMAVGIFLGQWIASWAAFPVALVICWILSKFKRFKRMEAK